MPFIWFPSDLIKLIDSPASGQDQMGQVREPSSREQELLAGDLPAQEQINRMSFTPTGNVYSREGGRATTDKSFANIYQQICHLKY